MPIPVPTLDHVVVNVRDRIHEGADTYRRLGFTLTPRGYHTLGSMNHLAMFGTEYLELIAAPPGSTKRPEILTSPYGLNGLVFGTEDSASVHSALTEAGIPCGPPLEFSRPVTLDDGSSGDATFRTVTLTPGTIPAGRVYFCHHFTRNLVWRDEWRHHANGAVAVHRAIIVEPDPAKAAQLYATMFGAEAVHDMKGGKALVVGNSRFEIVTEKALKDEFGRAVPDAEGRPAYMAGLTFRTTSLAKVSKVLAAGGIMGVTQHGNRIIVPASQAMNATIEFIQ